MLVSQRCGALCDHLGLAATAVLRLLLASSACVSKKMNQLLSVGCAGGGNDRGDR